MNKISVFMLVGENGITIEDGQKLFEAITPGLRAKEPVLLDFAGVRVFASPFFNASLGRALKDVTLSELRQIVKVSNLNQLGESVLDLVLTNSEEYYRNPAARKALDVVLTAVIEKPDADSNR
jgi:hypothetical protein